MNTSTKLALSLSLFSLSLFSHINAADLTPDIQLHKEQHLKRGNNAEPGSLDPQKIEDVPGSHIAKDLFEGLVQQNANGEIIPAGATNWTVSADHKIYTFNIRKGLKWSNDDPITANDFAYGLQRAVDPATASRYSWFLEMASIQNAGDIIRGKKNANALGVKALDDHTLQITLDNPIPYFVKMLAHQTTFPVPQKIVEKYGINWTKPENIVSNGAYTLTDWVVNEKITLKRNPNYWDNSKTVIDTIEYLPIVSPNTELSRYKANEIDMTASVSLEHFKTLQKEIPNEIVITPALVNYYYVFNTAVKPFDDWRIRKALSLAIDRDVITKNVLGQGQKSLYVFTPEAVADFTPPTLEYATWTQKERTAEAMRLMKEAGYGQGQKQLSFNLLYNTSEDHKKIALVVSQMWKPLGVQVKLENQEWKTFLDTRREKNFQVARAGWSGDYNDASTMLDLLTSYNSSNDSCWANKEYDALMEKTRLIADNDKRELLFTQAEKIIASEAPVAPIYQSVNTRLVKPYVGGYPLNNVELTVYSKDLYIIKH